MTPYLQLAGLLAFIAFCWWVRKAGADSAQNKANTDVLKDLGNLSKPIDPAERDKLQRAYRRD